MRKLLFFALIAITVDCTAQWSGTFYVAAKSGLSLREKKDANSKLIVKIPYGTKVTISYTDETVTYTAEGMEGQWATTTFGGKKGYIVNTYLLPWPPPKEAVKTMKQYLPQVSAIAGAPVIIKANGIETLETGGSSMKKQLFKNGAEYHEESFYESNNDAYFLPGFTLQQGFILVRLIPEFKSVFAGNAAFPHEDLTTKQGQNQYEYKIKVEKEMMGDNDWVTKIKVEYEEGAYYTFEMFVLGGQLVISYGGGV